MRSAVFNIVFYVNVLVLMIGGLPSIFMGRRAAMGMAKLWARTSLWFLDKICGLRVEFRGLELVPKDGVIIAAKHQSILETFALIIHIPDFAYVFKRELNWIPLFGWYLMAVDQIAIDRSAGSTALTQVTNGIARFLKERRAIFIFPEGTRRAVGAPATIQAWRVSRLLDARRSCRARRAKHRDILASTQLLAKAGHGRHRVSSGHRAGADD